jgi:hypothetical protein
VHHRPEDLVAVRVEATVVGQTFGLHGAELVAEGAQMTVIHGPGQAASLLKTEQDLGDHQRHQTDEADLAGVADRRLGVPPATLVRGLATASRQRC